MDDLIPRLLRLWEDVPPADDEARAAFGELYADPVRINGAEMTLDALVQRARRTAAALEGLTTEVLSIVSSGDRVAVAFRMHGRHVGLLDTSLGPVPGRGEPVTVQVIDVLTFSGGRIVEIWMVADLLGALGREGVVQLTPPS